MTTQMNELDVMEAIDACPALVEFRLVCYEVKGGFATILSMGHFFRSVVSIDDLMWTLEYWRYNGVYGELPVDAPITIMSMRHMTRLAGVIETIAMDEDRDVAPPDIASSPLKETDAMKIMGVTDAMTRIPALASLSMFCGGSRNGIVTMLSHKYHVRFLVAYEDAMKVLAYWRENGVNSTLPVGLNIATDSVLHMERMASFTETAVKEDSKARVIVYDNPMVSMLESDHLANIEKMKELTEQVSALKTMLAGMKLVSDANEDIIASQESELIRINALLDVPKKRKAKVSKEEKFAQLWLSLPKQAESLWGISVSKGSKCVIAHTDWRNYWFETLAHAEGFIKAWAIEGERPSLSNLRIGMKPMKGDDDA